MNRAHHQQRLFARVARGKDFVSYQVHTNVSGFGTIEVERGDGLPDVLTELVPSVALGKDRFCQAFGAVPAISLLRDLEDKFIHITTLVESGDLAQ
jgi:hypothetical protein